MNIHPEYSITRTGKIARLPVGLRHTLNERLEDNEPAPCLLEWLNSLPETKQVLDELFAGRPISEQNLSAWKQGGFRDWQRCRRVCERTRAFFDETEQVNAGIAATGETAHRRSLLDRLGDRLALTLLQLLHEAEDSEPGPTRTRTILELARELTRLRRGDQQRQYAALAQERWLAEREQAARAQADDEEKKRAAALAALGAQAAAYREEYLRGEAFDSIPLERTRWIRRFFALHKEALREHGFPGLPRGQEFCDEMVRLRTDPAGFSPTVEDIFAHVSRESSSTQPKANQGESR